MFQERFSRLIFLNKIAKQIFASDNLLEKDMFTIAEEHLPFKIRWVKKIWNVNYSGQDENQQEGVDHEEHLEPHQKFMSKSFFDDFFPEKVINFKNKNKLLVSLTNKYLDKFISDNWKFLFEISNEEGVQTEDDLKFIGSGYFGKVFVLPSGNILKIAERSYQQLDNLSEYKEEDVIQDISDYGEILDNKQQKYRTHEIGTRYLPKILEVYRIVLGNKTFYATLMKKIDTLNLNDSVARPAENSTESNSRIFSDSFNEKRKINEKISIILRSIKELYNFFFNEKLGEIESIIGRSLDNPYGIDEYLNPYFEFNQNQFERLWNLIIDSCIESIESVGLHEDEYSEPKALSSMELSNIEKLKKLYFKDIKKECADFIDKNIFTSTVIAPIKNDIENYIKNTAGERKLKKMKEDWFEIFIKSVIDSCVDSNIDINIENIGLDDRGYIIIFDS